MSLQVGLSSEVCNTATPCVQVALCPALNRTGAVWHVCVEGLRDPATLCWAWRADADISWADGSRFVPSAPWPPGSLLRIR